MPASGAAAPSEMVEREAAAPAVPAPPLIPVAVAPGGRRGQVAALADARLPKSQKRRQDPAKSPHATKPLPVMRLYLHEQRR